MPDQPLLLHYCIESKYFFFPLEYIFFCGDFLTPLPKFWSILVTGTFLTTHFSKFHKNVQKCLYYELVKIFLIVCLFPTTMFVFLVKKFFRFLPSFSLKLSKNMKNFCTKNTNIVVGNRQTITNIFYRFIVWAFSYIFMAFGKKPDA